jgi:hypothetical protein
MISSKNDMERELYLVVSCAGIAKGLYIINVHIMQCIFVMWRRFVWISRLQSTALGKWPGRSDRVSVYTSM